MVRDYKPSQWAIDAGHLGTKFGVIPAFIGFTLYWALQGVAWVGPNVLIPWQQHYIRDKELEAEANQNIVKTTEKMLVFSDSILRRQEEGKEIIPILTRIAQNQEREWEFLKTLKEEQE